MCFGDPPAWRRGRRQREGWRRCPLPFLKQAPCQRKNGSIAAISSKPKFQTEDFAAPDGFLAPANQASVIRHKLQSDMPSAKRVLLVDDDAVLRASLAEQLTREGPYAVIEAASAAQARELAKEGGYALAIVDQGLPDGAGDALARELKAQGFDAPILLLSDRDAPSPAAEHIEKPFRFADLLARLNLHLSRHAASDDLPVAIGPYLFRPGA